MGPIPNWETLGANILELAQAVHPPLAYVPPNNKFNARLCPMVLTAKKVAAIDGTGAVGWRTNVAIAGGNIIKMGVLSGTPDKTIDAD